MTFDLSKLITVHDTEGDHKQVVTEPHVMYPAVIARIQEVKGWVEKEFGTFGEYIAAGTNKQMRFAIQYQVTDAELPILPACYVVSKDAFEDALRPVWELEQAELRHKTEDVMSAAEDRLFQRAWALDCALSWFMRSMKVYSSQQGWGYNTEIKRDLRYRHAWISEMDAQE